MRTPLNFATALVICSLAACGSPSGTESAASSLQSLAPAEQTGSALEVLPDIPIAVTDRDGNPVAGATVAFTIVDGGGTLSTAQATSDALGNARVQWTLGPRTGTQHLRATLPGAPAAEAIVTATARQQLLGARQGQVMVLLNADNVGEKSLREQGIMRSVRADNTLRDGIFVMNADGTGAAPLTGSATVEDQHVDWSPDGRRLVFARASSVGGRIFVVNADGTGLAQLSNAESATPRWSPDGTRIAFALQSPSSTASEIAVMDADGANLRYVTTNQGGNQTPDWSPDGSRIVYASGRTGQPQIYVIGADGTGDRLLATTLPPNHMYDADPAWSRDGGVIAFARAVASVDGTTYSTSMYTIRPDGSGLTLLTTGPGAWETPRWRP
jgi:hypothetical protein